MTISVLDRTSAADLPSLGNLHDEAGRVDEADLPCRVNNPELWFAESPSDVEFAKVLVKHGTRTVQALVRNVTGKLDLASFQLEPTSTLELNDIGHAQLRLAAPLPLENYLHHRRTGAFLVIDPLDGNTLAAGLVNDHPGDHEDERYSI
jgi:sulfate adenylyltransferase subunit 1